VTTSDKAGLDAHLAGGRHKAKVEGDDEEGKPKRKERKIKEEGVAETTKVECSICKVMCPSIEGYNLHIQGEAHRIAADKIGNLVAANVESVKTETT